jgi:hypothetical protein
VSWTIGSIRRRVWGVIRFARIAEQPSSLLRVVTAGFLAALVLAPGALALACPNVPLDERLDEADAAFVGRVTAERSVVGGHVYRFLVDQNVKGPIGREVEVRSAERLVDANDKPILHDEALGVLATLNGAELTTESCLLSDPGTLLATSDEPRGNGIKVVVGLVILALVLAYSVRRLRHRRAELAARGRLGP